MKYLLLRVPTWSQLKVLGNSKTIKTSYFWLFIVPIISKVFSHLNDVINVSIFGATWSLNTTLPFNLNMFYFSAVSFAIASLIYKIWCPPGIDKYDTYEEYKEKGKSTDSLISSMWAICNIKKLHWPFKTRPVLCRRFIHDFTNYVGDLRVIDMTKRAPIKIENAGIKKDRVKAAYFLVTDTWNLSRPVIRLICTTSYLIGFVFFGVVLVENFIYVIRFM